MEEDFQKYLDSLQIDTSDCVAVYVSGSISRGWQHSRSDLDIFLITPGSEEAVKKPSEYLTWFNNVGIGFVGNVRVDIEYWNEGHVDSLLSRVRSRSLEDDGAPTMELSEMDMDFIYRLSTAIPLGKSASWVSNRKLEIAASAATRIYAARALHIADSLLDDATGFLASSDLSSAVVATHDAFGFCVDALLFMSGDLCPTPKWRPRRMSEAKLQNLSFQQYWAIETYQGLVSTNLRAWAESTLEVARELQGLVDFND